MQQPITLYLDGYFVNQWDGTCLVALTEKGLPFATARALLRDGQGVPAALTELTGIARVPAFSHGDMWLTESSAIVEYLEDVFPAPDYPRLLPADPRKRARARQVMAWLRADLALIRDERPWWMAVYRPPASKPLSEEARVSALELITLATRVVSSGELDEFTIAHADLAFTLMRLSEIDPPLPEAVLAFVDATLARPSLRAYLDHPRPPNPPPIIAQRG